MRASVVAVAFALLRSTVASAGGPCSLSIRVDGLEAQWSAALDALESELQRRDDVDKCASLVLERAGEGARVTLVLNDGRLTERTVSDPRDLPAVVAALVLLPASDPAAPPPPPEEPLVDAVAASNPVPAARERSSEAGITREPSAAATPTPFGRARRARVELGGFGGTRWSGATPAGAVGLLADMRLGDWVLGAHGRWDGYASTLGVVDYTAQALSIGADVGRDFRVGPTSLTALAGPSFVSLSQSLQSTPASVYVSTTNPKTGRPIGSVTPTAREGRVLRLGGALRWNLLAHEPMRVFVEASAEIDVSADAGNTMPPALAATGPLPIWGAGLSLGGAVAVWP